MKYFVYRLFMFLITRTRTNFDRRCFFVVVFSSTRQILAAILHLGDLSFGIPGRSVDLNDNAHASEVPFFNTPAHLCPSTVQEWVIRLFEKPM
jgi:hypothetical protein